MLYEANQFEQLGVYVKQMNDFELSHWWGQYCESVGDMPAAVEAYQQANDTLALVRLYCRNEDFVAASNLVEECDSAAAAFLLARQLEATDQVLLQLCRYTFVTYATVTSHAMQSLTGLSISSHKVLLHVAMVLICTNSRMSD